MMAWLERQRALLDFTLACLWRRKWKNLATLLVYTLMVFLLSSVIFFTGALREVASDILDDAPQMIVQRVMGGRYQVIPLEYAQVIDDIRGAGKVFPRLWGYYFHPAAGANYTIMAPEAFPHADKAVAVGSGVMRTWKTRETGRLFFKTITGQPLELQIADTFAPEDDLVAADMILMSETAFRRISGIPVGFATDLAVRIRNQQESRVIAEKIAAALPDTRVILREDILSTYDALFDWRSGYVVVLLVGAVLAFFIFAWDKATGLSAEEKAEIGILKGLGWDTADVLYVKIWEGAAISLLAFFFGVALAYVHVFFASAVFFEHALKGWSVVYPEFSLKPFVGFYQLAILFCLTVMPYSFITLFPAWAASVMDPETVMRQ